MLNAILKPMGDELKRFVLIAVVMVVLALGLLLPLSRVRLAQRPSGAPETAVLASAIDGSKLWIDCSLLSARQFHCSIYQPDGALLSAGTFQEAGFTGDHLVHYDGTNIYWKFGAFLRPLRLDCIRGGRPPFVPDCKN